MSIPDDLAHWRYETVVEVVERHEYEPARFDYKAALNPTGSDSTERDEHLASIRRTVCAMANTGGGFILFGVRDRRHKVTRQMDRIVGIPRRGDPLSEFGNKVKAIQPEIHFEATTGLLSAMPDADTGVFVVHVPESERRPHMVIPPNVFYRRGDGGTAVAMDFYEVRDQMLGGEERRRKGQLLIVKAVQYREMAEEIDGFGGSVQNYFGTFDTPFFDTLVMDLFGIPLDAALLRQLMNISSIAGRINTVLQIARTR